MKNRQLHSLGLTPVTDAVAEAALTHESNDSRGRLASHPRRNQRGVTIIEFALVLPVLFILILSVLDFGLCFFAQHTLQFATREGVRMALVGRTLTDTNGNPMSREQSIISTIQGKANIAIPTNKLSISIFAVPADMSDPGGWEGSQDAGLGGQYMRVRTSYDYHFLTPVLAACFSGGKLKLQAQSTYRNEQF